MKKIVLIFSLLISVVTIAQTELIAYPSVGKGVASTFVTDYHALGINPANLGWKAYDDKSVTFGTTELGFSVNSEALTNQGLRDDIKGVVVNRTLDSLSSEEKLQAIQSFTDNPFNFSFNSNVFGISYQNEVFGGIALSIRTRANWSSTFNQEFTDLLFKGNQSSYFDSLSYVSGIDTSMVANNGSYADSSGVVLNGQANIPLNISQLIDGTSLKLSWNREYHFGYGRRIFNIEDKIEVFAGAGVKYIQGIAYFNLEGEGGNLKMISALSSGFDLDYGIAALNNPYALNQNPEKIFKSSVGNGWGFDLGAHVLLLNKIHIAASVTDIGSMTYTGNVYEAIDTLVVDISNSGLQDVNITNSVPNLLEDTGLLKLKGKESFTVSLPATFRIGGSIELGKVAHFGIDLVAPLNDVPGSFNAFSWGVGGDIKLFKGSIVVMTGMTGGGGHSVQIPLGINFVLKGGTYELGIASRDAVTFFRDNAPSISAAMGFARIRF
jgi:hypothetical protein